ncbi:MAG: hypothetical protein A2X86_01255 [Bdellovibrionales bacterium GWA2_49_15]|nr:MAG: hypothetical protein A2X86_01255 [Bdellovibrionales bacterium GWA2_49_15]HAZ12148.1 hypothetical protein [Bdellovibrionales bacterium]
MRLENWNFCCYQTSRQRAFISMGGEHAESGEIKFVYFATVTELEGQEIYQRAFHDLADAITFLNQTYGHWPFLDLTVPKSGCSTCHAH